MDRMNPSCRRVFPAALLVPLMLVATANKAGATYAIRDAVHGRLDVAHANPQDAQSIIFTTQGTDMGPNAVIYNLYWDPNGSTCINGEAPAAGESCWDADSPVSSETIDSFTEQAVQSDYFDDLSQYGIDSVTFGGSVTAAPSCGSPTTSTGYFALSGFILCESQQTGFSEPNENTLWMVYAPPETSFDTAGYENCSAADPSGTWDGFHAVTLPSVIPPEGSQDFGYIATQCDQYEAGYDGLSMLDNITQTASHEIVEGITDPDAFGWIDRNLAGTVNIGPVTVPNQGELADVCAQGLDPPAPGNPPSYTLRVSGYAMSFYWSNNDNSCAPLQAPSNGHYEASDNLTDTMNGTFSNSLDQLEGWNQFAPGDISQASYCGYWGHGGCIIEMHCQLSTQTDCANAGVSLYQDTYVPGVSGQQYTLSAWLRCNKCATIVTLNLWDIPTVGTESNVTKNIQVVNTWTHYAVTITVPTTQSFRLRSQIYYNTPLDNIDMAQVALVRTSG